MTDHIFRFFLDDVQYESPIGWDKWEELLERSAENGLLMLSNVQLEFYGEAFRYLKKKFDQDRGGRVRFRLVDTNSQNGSYEGLLFLTDVEWFLTYCKAKTPITDDSFYAWINNNKSVKFTVSAGVSKNQRKIPVAIPYMLGVNKVSDNTLLRTIYSVRLFEAFRYAVEFMTDGLLEFRSDTFSITGPCAGWCITNGLKLSSTDPSVYAVAGDSPIPEFSFSDLLSNVGKELQLGYRIEKDGNRTIFRLESLDQLFTNNRMATIINVPELKLSTVRDKLFAKVKVGSGTTNEDGSFPEDITLYGFKEEEFPVLGTSNIDSFLDLIQAWIVSSNCIEFAAESGSYNGEYDNDIILIQSTPSSEYAGSTVNSNYLQLGSPIYFYNETFTNVRVLERFLSAIPAPLYSQKLPDDTSQTFSANKVTNSVIPSNAYTRHADYDNELADPGNNYAANKFIAPFGGAYKFYADRVIIQGGSLAAQERWRLMLRIEDGLGNTLNEYNMFTPNSANNWYVILVTGTTYLLGGLTLQVNLKAGDVVKIIEQYNLDAPSTAPVVTSIGSDSLFKCIEAVVKGGTYIENDGVQFKALRYSAEAALTRGQYDKIRKLQTGTILLKDAFGNQGEGWIENFTYNNLNSRLKVNLLTNIQLS